MSANGKKKKAEDDAREAERRRMEVEKAGLEKRGTGKTKRTPPQPRSEAGGSGSGGSTGRTAEQESRFLRTVEAFQKDSEDVRRDIEGEKGERSSENLGSPKLVGIEREMKEMRREVAIGKRLVRDGKDKLAELNVEEMRVSEGIIGMYEGRELVEKLKKSPEKRRIDREIEIVDEGLDQAEDDLVEAGRRLRALERAGAEERGRLARIELGMRSGSSTGSLTGGEEGKKRKKTGEEEGEEEEGVRSIVDWIRELEDVLEIMGKKKAVSVGEKNKIRDVIDGLRREETKARVEIGYWKGRSQGVEMNIEGIKKELTEIRKELKEMGRVEVSGGKEGDRQSYAVMAGGGGRGEGRSDVPGVTGVRGLIPRISSVVLIRHETKQAEEVKKVVKEIVDPVAVDVNVRRVNLIKNGIRVETGTEEEVGKLLGHKGLLDAGMKVGRPERKKPVIMIYDMPQRLSDDVIREEIYVRTMKDSGIEEVEFKENFEIKHRYKNRRGGDGEKEKEHVVVRCNGRIRNWIRRRERIFMGWESCRVKDYMDVARCYKCQGFGHVAKYCDRKVCCERCTGEHDRKDCQKGRDEVRCGNCSREGKEEVGHEAGDKGCPIYQRAEKRYLESVDYSV